MRKFESIRIPRRRVAPIPKRDYIPSREEIQRMVQCSNLRDAAMISILAESGMGVGPLVGLRYADIKEEFERKSIPLKINVPGMRGYITFVGEDAFRYLNRYLQGRELADEDLLFPLKASSANRRVRMIARRAGIPETFRPYNFRRRVRIAYSMAGLPSRVADLLMGRKPKWAGELVEFFEIIDVNILRQAYQKATQQLRIFD